MTSTGAASTGPATALRSLVDALVAVPVDDVPNAELAARLTAVAAEVARLEGWLQAAAGRLDRAGGGKLDARTPVARPASSGSADATAAGETDDSGQVTEGGEKDEDGWPGRPVDPDDARPAVLRSVTGWLAQVRRDTASRAGGTLRTARLLHQGLPLVAEAVLAGRLTCDQARLLTRFVGQIDPVELRATQPDLIEVAAALDPHQLARWVAHQIATHCEPAAEDDEQSGRARRYLQTRRDSDGMLRGRFALSREDSEMLLTALEPLARRDRLVDERSAGQRRADALIEICEQVLRHGMLPDTGGRRPQLTYVLPADWAARRAEQTGCRDCGPRCEAHRLPDFRSTAAAALSGQPGIPAEHACAVGAWSGPQTRGLIEALLCDARIERVLLDGIGQVRGLESLQDDPTAAQRRVLAARDLGCVARGCTRPAAFCDAHHLVGVAVGGPTDVDNLVLLCRRHHRRWHLGHLGMRDLHVPWHRDADLPGHPSTAPLPGAPPPRDRP